MTKPRCSNHKDRIGFPATCPTCVRIKVEHDIVTRTVDVLLQQGYLLQTNQGGEGLEPVKPTADRKLILSHLNETDDELLLVSGPEGQRIGSVYFVYGNDGWDVISDYSTNLEEVLAPVMKYAETL